MLVDKSNITNDDAKSIIENRVSNWGLARYLILHSKYNQSTDANDLVEEKVDREKLAEYLLEFAEFQTNQNGVLTANIGKAKQAVEDIVNKFLSDQVIEELVTTKADQ